ncbi:hypothetical protein SRABI106_04776 [Rahnella aquatilis]|nr:hypothetical protein SRABI106_04776 [Rahnella aquatilis]
MCFHCESLIFSIFDPQNTQRPWCCIDATSKNCQEADRRHDGGKRQVKSEQLRLLRQGFVRLFSCALLAQQALLT